MTTLKFSELILQPRGLDPEQAAAYVGSAKLLTEYVEAGWIRPFCQRNRLTRYDRLDLDACIDRHKAEEPQAAAAV